ncbi:MAG: universal stress protein [Rhodospirillales bacterium]|nr:universal stress protein [Rhodospirillales bacterium]
MYRQILLSIDVNQPSSWEKALPVALEFCHASGAKLHLLGVVPDFGKPIVAQYFPADYAERARSEAMAALKKLSAQAVPPGIDVEHLIGYGTIYQEILRVAKEVGCDLIVMASHRPELKDYLLGPNAARVVRHADCSVLVVRD